jgi:hypothetical protein
MSQMTKLSLPSLIQWLVLSPNSTITHQLASKRKQKVSLHFKLILMYRGKVKSCSVGCRNQRGPSREGSRDDGKEEKAKDLTTAEAEAAKTKKAARQPT